MLTKDRIGALLLLVFCGAYALLATEIQMLPFQRAQAFNAQTMPIALGVIGVIISFLILVSPGSDEKPDLRGYQWGLGATMIGLMVLYGFTIRPLGFLLSTTILLVGGYVALGERKPLNLVLASVPLVVAFWLLMTQVLDVYVAPLPEFMSGG